MHWLSVLGLSKDDAQNYIRRGKLLVLTLGHCEDDRNANLAYIKFSKW